MIIKDSNPLLITLLFFLCQNSAFAQNTKQLEFKDKAYEEEIKTVLLYPFFGDQWDYNRPTVVPLRDQRLVLEFDDLRENVDRYYGKILHCHQNWSQSDLADLDYLTAYNEFPINDFEYSIDTYINYVHYSAEIPHVKLPGNYVLVVYREGNPEDIVLSKRFMVFDNRIQFDRTGSLVSGGSVANLNQQINFTITYKNLDLVNPMQSVNVSIRQNQRWDNMATEVKPSFPREFEHELEYRFYDDSKMFKGGNEFRFFDLRSLNYPGRNVASINKKARPYEAYIALDKSRNGEVYSQYEDRNGRFVLDNLDYNTPLTSNYVFVNFTLQAPTTNLEKVFIRGAFNNWGDEQENEMVYDNIQKEYKARFLLKQGYYDYMYWTESKKLPPYYLEGSHFQTQNGYEIFVYYHEFRQRIDLLIGYIRIEENEY